MKPLDSRSLWPILKALLLELNWDIFLQPDTNFSQIQSNYLFSCRFGVIGVLKWSWNFYRVEVFVTVDNLGFNLPLPSLKEQEGELKSTTRCKKIPIDGS